MYLGVIYVSEITGATGKVNKNFLDGDFPQQPKTKHNYPDIRKPTKAAWSEWKAFIF